MRMNMTQAKVDMHLQAKRPMEENAMTKKTKTKVKRMKMMKTVVLMVVLMMNHEKLEPHLIAHMVRKTKTGMPGKGKITVHLLPNATEMQELT
jgi:hypothetical protein